MEKQKSISKWIDAMAVRGHYIFSKADLKAAFPDKSSNVAKTDISRLLANGTIVSPWHNFFVIVPIEYKLKGIVPPMFYMDNLMSHLRRPYYVALLNAAEMYGAAHQRPQNFTVFTEGRSLRSGIKAGTEVLLYCRSRLPMDFVRKFQTQMGYVNVSSPELTALDLVSHEHAVGGLTRAATVLEELVEEISFSTVDPKLLGFFGTPVVQRLGYMLDAILDESEKADELFALAKTSNLHFRKEPLKSGKDVSNDSEIDKKWKIIVNQQIEIDEV